MSARATGGDEPRAAFVGARDAVLSVRRDRSVGILVSPELRNTVGIGRRVSHICRDVPLETGLWNSRLRESDGVLERGGSTHESKLSRIIARRSVEECGGDECELLPAEDTTASLSQEPSDSGSVALESENDRSTERLAGNCERSTLSGSTLASSMRRRDVEHSVSVSRCSPPTVHYKGQGEYPRL